MVNCFKIYICIELAFFFCGINGYATLMQVQFSILVVVPFRIHYIISVSFHTKVREFCSLGINSKIDPKESTVNTNPNNQSQSIVVLRYTVAPCPYIYRHSGVRTV